MKVLPVEDAAIVSEEGRKKRAVMMRRRSTASCLNDEYERKINSYVEQRARAKAAAQLSVSLGGMGLTIVTSFAFIVVMVTENWGWWSHVLFIAMQLGMVVAATSDLDVDGVARSNRLLSDGMVFAVAALWGSVSLDQNALNGPWSAFCLAPLLLYPLRRRHILERGAPLRYTQMIGLVFVLQEGTKTVGALHRVLVLHWRWAWVLVFTTLVSTLACTVVWSARAETEGTEGDTRLGLGGCCGERFGCCGVLSFRNPTVRFWAAFATYNIGHSLNTALTYLLYTLSSSKKMRKIWPDPDHQAAPVAWFCVAAWLGLLLCRDSFFGIFARRFERQNRLRDGAVIASLLEKRSIIVGDEYHVQDLEAHVTHSTKHFYRGTVVEVGQAYFVVEIDESELPAPDSIAKRTVVQLAQGNHSPQALMVMARDSLYGVDFKDLTLDMFGRTPPNLEWFEMSRRCKPGQIDWFISHSWNDSPQTKYFALLALAEDFRQENGRLPVVWLDKCCIEQTSQSKVMDALKCLPLYLNACNTTVVLATESYFTRMWCIWELYVLFALADGEPSLKVLQLSDESASARLRNFSLARARCFDPNQEAELRDAIDASPGGAGAFERTLQALASRLSGAVMNYEVVDVRRGAKRKQPSFKGHRPGSFRVEELGTPVVTAATRKATDGLTTSPLAPVMGSPPPSDDEERGGGGKEAALVVPPGLSSAPSTPMRMALSAEEGEQRQRRLAAPQSAVPLWEHVSVHATAEGVRGQRRFKLSADAGLTELHSALRAKFGTSDNMESGGSGAVGALFFVDSDDEEVLIDAEEVWNDEMAKMVRSPDAKIKLQVVLNGVAACPAPSRRGSI